MKKLSFRIFLVSSIAVITSLAVTFVHATERSRETAYEFADQAYKAFAKKEYDIAANKARQALEFSPHNASYRQLYVQALLELGKKEEAHNQLVELVRMPEHGFDLDLAYFALQTGDDSLALDLFNRANEQGKLTDTARLDAAYVASRTGQNDQAISYFNQSVDAAEADSLKLDPQRVYDLRRATADLSRSWGINALVSQSRTAVGGLEIPTGTSASTTYMGAEAYWRPFRLQNRRLLEIYGRLSENISGGEGVQTGSATAQAAFGARVKPFGDFNAMLALERLVSLGNATNSDWLVRLGFSSDTGLDLRIDKDDWFSSHLYAEAGHYFRNPQNYAVVEQQVGRSYRVGDNQSTVTVFPHLVLGGDYDSEIVDHDKQAWGAGLGVNTRYWFRQDRYQAPRSYADLSLQYRWRIAGDRRAQGWFIRLSASY